MGCGKSYWGKQLAAHSQRPFIDLDQRLEKMEGKTISELFSTLGEEVFRTLENQYLRQLKDIAPAIIATGGGTPCFFDNLAQMQQMGKSIFLDVPEEVLFQRLAKGRAKRPLISQLDDQALLSFIHERLEARRPFYTQADVHIGWIKDANAYREALLKHL